MSMKLSFDEILLLVKDKQFKESLKYINKLISENGDNFNYLHLKGTLEFNVGEFSNALISFSSALELKKNDYNVHHLRGITYYNLNKFSEAEKDLEKAISLKNNFPEAYFSLGLLYFEHSKTTEAIENFIKSIELNKNFKKPAKHLIKALTRTKNIKETNSSIVSKHNELNNINLYYNSTEYLDDKIISDFIKETNKIIGKKFQDLDYNETQIYRRNQDFLNCRRHKKVFDTYDVIPKFCFNCYKVQVEPENLIDLIKLYIIFDNISLPKNNIRKCMIEKRANISGKYKGLIYCSSIEESKLIEKKLNIILKNNLNKLTTCKIKRGCSEFALKYPKYNSFEKDSLDYKEDWKNYEALIDNKYPHLTFDKKTVPTIKGISLSDVLIIRNWITFAKMKGDDINKLITD
jgi:tetratricopeptide (TPR) repeat protein